MGIVTVDSSVLIAGLQRWHQAHERAAAALVQEGIRMVGHVLFETYSALTGGGFKPRARPDDALAILTRFGPPLTLSTEGHLSALRTCATKGIVGGAIYDALIAATALESNARLLSRDLRAARTYEAIGVRYELI